MRYINTMENYTRALKNNFKIAEPLSAGLQACCCLVNISVWQQFKFDEQLLANEDKEWSLRVMNAGYEILDFNETYFYFVKRNLNSQMKRVKIETISALQLNKKKYPSRIKIFAYLFKKLFVINPVSFFKTCYHDFHFFKAMLHINKALKDNN